MRATGRLPDWYEEQPPTVRGDDFWLLAFNCLATDRQLVGNGGIGPIPWSKAILYGKEAGFDRRTRWWFAQVMLTLDTLWRERKREDNDKEQKRAEKAQAREAERKAKQIGLDVGRGIAARRKTGNK